MIMKNNFRFLWPLYINQFFWSFNFIVSIWILFFQSRGLTLADIGLIATATYLGLVLFEYPTGIFADKYGRKLSLIFSVLLYIISLLLEVTAYSLVQFFIAAFLLGVSYAFTSGALQALVYDKLKENKLEKSNSKVTGLIDTISFTGLFVSSLTGAVIFVYNAAYPFWLSIIFSGIALVSLLFLKEAKYKEKDEKIDTLKQFKDGFKLILNKPVLLSLLLIYFPLFLFEDAWYNSNQKILVDIGLPIVLLGVYSSAIMFSRIIGGIYLPKIVERVDYKKLIFLTIILEAITFTVLGTNFLYFVIASAIIMGLLHPCWNYIDAHIVHEHIPSNLRATALSARQMIISLIWVPIPWMMGYLVNTFDKQYLFFTFGIIILLTGMGVFFIRKNKL